MARTEKEIIELLQRFQNTSQNVVTGKTTGGFGGQSVWVTLDKPLNGPLS